MKSEKNENKQVWIHYKESCGPFVVSLIKKKIQKKVIQNTATKWLRCELWLVGQHRPARCLKGFSASIWHLIGQFCLSELANQINCNVGVVSCSRKWRFENGWTTCVHCTCGVSLSTGWILYWKECYTDNKKKWILAANLAEAALASKHLHFKEPTYCGQDCINCIKTRALFVLFQVVPKSSIHIQ